MAKIKLNLPTGISEEKNLLSCFKESGNIYIVFDAESVGSMGLPIILVCKLVNNRVIKVDNQDEWTKVKGYLKEIISGVSKEYLNLSSSIEADEVFYTQLTLPLASFDALKNAYNIPNESNTRESNTNGQEILSVNESQEKTINIKNESVENQELVNSNSEVELTGISPVNSFDNKLDNNVLPAEIDSANPNEISVLSSNEAVANPLIGDNIMPNLDLQQTQETIPVQNEISLASNDQPIVNEESSFLDDSLSNVENISMSTINYIDEKDAFLKACSNMFDALVAKIQPKNNSNNN